MKTNNRSLKYKLLTSYAIGVGIVLAVGLSGVMALHRVDSTYGHISEVVLPNTVYLGNMRAARGDMVIAAAFLAGSHASQAELKRSQDLADAAVVKFEKSMKGYEELPWADGEEELWNQAKKYWEPFKQSVQKVIALSSSGTAADEKAREALINGKFEQVREELRLGIERLVDLQQKEDASWVGKAKGAATAGNVIAGVGILLGSIFMILFGIKFSDSLSKVLEKVAQTLGENSGQVRSAAEQISTASQQLSQASTEQAASIEETSSSIEEMSAMIKKNSENSGKAAEVSGVTQKSAIRGKEVVGVMLKAMDDINESNNQISEIVKVIGEIENKTKVINDIVFKTQLLSFNASVEAARAGTHGRGFAVVAEEVGELAQLSGNAAQEISKMLSESIQKVESLVNTGKEKVKVGTEVSKQCGAVLEEIVTNVGTLSDMAKEIATASHEQSQGAGEVSRAMVQLDQVTQENAASAEEAASAAEELSAQAEALRSVVETLLVTVRGGDAETYHTASPAPITPAHHAGAQAKILQFKKANPVGTGGTGHESDVDSVAENDPRFKEI